MSTTLFACHVHSRQVCRGTATSGTPHGSIPTSANCLISTPRHPATLFSRAFAHYGRRYGDMTYRVSIRGKHTLLLSPDFTNLGLRHYIENRFFTLLEQSRLERPRETRDRLNAERAQIRNKCVL